jgi:2-isopropylmalate synthase
MNNANQITIFDTTLRDGEQSPGASMTREEKVRIARALERLRVDVIEAGFPAASQGDFESVRAVAETIKDARVCGLARANEADIDRAGEAIAPAAAGRIHTFIATSPVHMEKKLQLTPDEVVERAVNAVARARNLCDDIVPSRIFCAELSKRRLTRERPRSMCRIPSGTTCLGSLPV